MPVSTINTEHNYYDNANAAINSVSTSEEVINSWHAANNEVQSLFEYDSETANSLNNDLDKDGYYGYVCNTGSCRKAARQADSAFENAKTSCNTEVDIYNEQETLFSDLGNDITNYNSSLSTIEEQISAYEVMQGNDEDAVASIKSLKEQKAEIETIIQELQDQQTAAKEARTKAGVNINEYKVAMADAEGDGDEAESAAASLGENGGSIKSSVDGIKAQAETAIQEAQSDNNGSTGAGADSDGDEGSGDSDSQDFESCASNQDICGDSDDAENTDTDTDADTTTIITDAVSGENEEASTYETVKDALAPQEQPAAQAETPDVTPFSSNEQQEQDLSAAYGISQEDIETRIENNETTDVEIANYIINDMFEGESLMMNTSELVGMDASDAVETATEAYTTEMYSKIIYSNNVSTNTDTATVEENQEAIGDFMGVYGETASRVDAPNVEFLSLTDSSNWANAQEFCARLNDGEYILTREIEKTTAVIENIEVATSQTEIEEEETSETEGEELLGDLEDVITEDETIADNDNDDVLTQNEYNEMENFFSNTDDVAAYYQEMVDDAKKYGIYADENAIAA